MANTINSISVSGIQAGFKRIEVSADNIARRHVTNSEKKRVVQEDLAGGGVKTKTQTIPLEEKVSSDEENRFYDSSNIDYAEESIEQTRATVSTKVALRAYETSKNFEDTVINLGGKPSKS